MARPLRLEFSGAVYHLTGRGNARQEIFFSDTDRELFRSTLSGVVRRYHWITPPALRARAACARCFRFDPYKPSRLNSAPISPACRQ